MDLHGSVNTSLQPPSEQGPGGPAPTGRPPGLPPTR